jgi:elongator complex protein 6
MEAEKNIISALASLSKPTSEGQQRKVTLLLDAPDILLATFTTTAAALNNFLLKLRSQASVHTTVLSLSADAPFVSAAVPESSNSRHTPIEAETASFITTQAHAARLVLSVRGLDTGAATDVSGVLRATRGGDHIEEAEVREGELLYLMQRDGNAKVFERGSG